MPGLLVRDGMNEDNPRDLQLYVIPSGEVFHLGTSESCEIILDDPEVSKIHASINLTSNQIWRVKLVDHNTALKVNSKEVEQKKLRNGDEIELGQSSITFFDTLLLGTFPLPQKPESKGGEPWPEAFDDSPMSLDGEDMLAHPQLKTPGVYLTHGGILGEFIHLQGQVLLGRSSQCTLVFRDVDVSRTHASLEINASGQVVLTDLASRNGVYINDRRIVDRCDLSGFDLIRMGNTEFIFLENDENIKMFKKLVRRGSILLKKVSSAGGQAQGIVPGGDKDEEGHAASPPKKSLIEVFKKESANQEEKEPEEDPPPAQEGGGGLVTSHPCPQCGEFNVEKAKFCNGCGAEVPSPQEAPSDG